MKLLKFILLSAAIGGLAAGTAPLATAYVPRTNDVKKAYDFKDGDQVIDQFDKAADRSVEGADAVVVDYNVAVTNLANGLSADTPLYKLATPEAKQNSILVLSVFLDGDIDESKIMFSPRGGGGTTGTPDEWGAAKSLTDLIYDDEGTPGPISSIAHGEWVDLRISLVNSYEDTDVYSNNAKITDGIYGLSFWNSDVENTGVFNIRKVSLVSGSSETVMDDFSRDNAAVAPAGAWWAGIGGTIERAHVAIADGSYTVKTAAALSYSNVGLVIKGDTSGTSLALVTDAAGTVGTSVAFADLKDNDGNALDPVTAGVYVSVAANIENSGLGSSFFGIKISSTTPITVKQVFGTDALTIPPADYYPNLDLESISWYSDFNFESTDNWPTEYGDGNANNTLKANGFNVVVNWHNAANVSFDGDALVLPALTSEQDYGSFYLNKAGTITAKDYFVMAVNLVDDASLDDLRINIGTNATLYAHDALSAPGLKATMGDIPNYPYATPGEESEENESGYTWLIWSLADNKLDPANVNGEITFYYGQKQGDIKIGDIFMADAKSYEREVLDDVTLDSELTATADYRYGGYVPADTKYYIFDIKGGVGGGSTSTLVVEQEGGASKYIKDGELIGADGQPLVGQTVAENETVTVRVDLEASGFDISHDAHYHLHFNAIADPVLDPGAISVGNIRITPYKTFSKELLGTPVGPVAVPGDAYNYVTGLAVGNYAGRYLTLTLSADADVADALKSLRLGIGSGTFWFDAEQDSHLVGRDGKPFDDLGITAEADKVVTIDLVKSGAAIYGYDTIHIHSGGGDVTPYNLTVKSAVLSRGTTPFETIGELPAQDLTAPTITIDAPASAYVGDPINIGYEVSDNVSAPENITTSIAVTTGSGDSLQTIDLDENNSFTPTTAGTYTITVTATDEAGNTATKTSQIEVTIRDSGNDSTGSSTGPGSSSGNGSGGESTGLGAGAIAGIVIGCVAGVGLIALGIWYLVKKFKK